jgi:hypothetical protein
MTATMMAMTRKSGLASMKNGGRPTGVSVGITTAAIAWNDQRASTVPSTPPATEISTLSVKS